MTLRSCIVRILGILIKKYLISDDLVRQANENFQQKSPSRNQPILGNSYLLPINFPTIIELVNGVKGTGAHIQVARTLEIRVDLVRVNAAYIVIIQVQDY